MLGRKMYSTELKLEIVVKYTNGECFERILVRMCVLLPHLSL